MNICTNRRSRSEQLIFEYSSSINFFAHLIQVND